MKRKLNMQSEVCQKTVSVPCGKGKGVQMTEVNRNGDTKIPEEEAVTKADLNSKIKDSSSKLIFGDAVLLAQFLRGYVDIPELKNVQAEDIEDVSERYVPLFVEERNSDSVSRVRISKEIPVYLVSLVEHKSKVDYNVVMQILRYMAYIWEDYEKEMERRQPGISKTKNFKYPPILPIIYYEGLNQWTAATRLHDRIFFSDIFKEFIPDYTCKLVELQNISNEELMKHEDELSLVMMISKLQNIADFSKLGEGVPAEYIKDVESRTPVYLADIIAKIVEVLLRNINVPNDEVIEYTQQIKERRMGMLFENLKGYDVQATRKEAQIEGRAEGRVEGEYTKLISLVIKQIDKGLSPSQIAAIFEEDLHIIQEIYDIRQENPEFTKEEIWERMRGGK